MHSLGSLIFNFSISSVVYIILNKQFAVLIVFAVLFIISVLTVATKISLDMSIDDTSIVSIIMYYLGSFIISCTMLYIAYIESYTIIFYILLIVIVVELCIIPLISYRYRIRNKIKAVFKKR